MDCLLRFSLVHLNNGVARRNQRGLSALAATLLVALTLSAGFAAWADFSVQRLRDAHITATLQWARAEARALHYWLHDKQNGDAHNGNAFELPGVGRARLDAAPGLSDYRAPWFKPPPGWTVHYVIANPPVQANNPDGNPNLRRAHGIVVINRPRPDGRRGSDARDRAILHALCGGLAPVLKPAAAEIEALARDAIAVDFGGEGCDPHAVGRTVALAAASHAGIDTELVLREARSGFAPQVMETALDMDGHAILKAGHVSAGSITGRSDNATLVWDPTQDSGNDGNINAAINGNVEVADGLVVRRELRAGSGEAAGASGVTAPSSNIADRLDVTGSLGSQGRPVRRMTLTGPPPDRHRNTLSLRSCTGC